MSPYYLLATLVDMKSVYCENGMLGFIRTMDKEADIAFQISRLMQINTEMGTKEEVFESIKD